MEPTYTRLHQTAAIGENSKRRFLRDMAGVHWGPPCFGYQGGPQRTPAILPEKSELSHGNFETKYPKAIVVPAHLYIGALVVSRVSGRVQQGVVCLYVLRPIRSTKANMDGCALRHFVPKVRGETVAQ